MQRRTQNIHERFLRHIWSKQYLKGNLTTADGASLQVMNVGEWNTGGGPDFLHAKIKLNGTTYAGDVEIHRTVFDWIQHRHQEDPRYNQVVLHVVLEAEPNLPPTLVQSGRSIPVLVMEQFLSESIRSIWHKAILDERAAKTKSIPCSGKNHRVDMDLLERWLEKLSVERLEIKLRRFDERLKQLARERQLKLSERFSWYGKIPEEGEQDEIPPPMPEFTPKDVSDRDIWEQILYEGVMEGLGYNKNQEPFARLAKNISLEWIHQKNFTADSGTLEALLFGASGLLPNISTLEEPEAQEYVRSLQKRWNEFRPNYRGEFLHEADWQFFPTRPTNFPTLRLAAAAQILHAFLTSDVFRSTIQLLKSNVKPAEKERQLVQLFSVETGEFWKRHYSFNETSGKPLCALGASRIREITVNTVLPIALLYARIFKDTSVRQGALAVYKSLPAAESNSLTRLMDEQLLRKRLENKSVCRQQAVIQLYKYYCSEHRCGECAVGTALA
ncbi:MAG TPA: DUF2851 family protein [Bacteroidota bacterium]|nr:DUF2851 family protein [Bacteroidota bacterium]